MSINFNSSQDKFHYFFNDGIISRMNLKDKKVEVRDLRTCLWKPTDNDSLIRKMMQGKGIIQEHEVETLFELLQTRIK